MGRRTGRNNLLFPEVLCGPFGDLAGVVKVGGRVVFILCSWSYLCGEASWSKCFMPYCLFTKEHFP